MSYLITKYERFDLLIIDLLIIDLPIIGLPTIIEHTPSITHTHWGEKPHHTSPHTI